MNTAPRLPPADRFSAAVDRLIGQVAHWQSGRWASGLQADEGGRRASEGRSGPGGPGPVASRGDRVYALVQRLADLVAEAEGGPRRPVPRLGDLVLPDQLRVMADDLLASGASAEPLELAVDEVDAVRRTL